MNRYYNRLHQWHAGRLRDDLEVPDAARDSSFLSLAAYHRRRQGEEKAIEPPGSARISTLTAMMGRKSIYERRVVTREEVDVCAIAGA